MISILFLAANPNEPPLQLYREYESIDDKIWISEYRDKFRLTPRFSVSLEKLSEYFIRFKPTIIHFSGHGTYRGSLVFLNKDGVAELADSKVLENIFRIFHKDIRCVILNACYSKKQASVLAKFIDCVIGIAGGIMDVVAITFASTFYYALCSGRTINEAYELGKHQVSLLTVTDHSGKLLDMTKQNNMIEIISRHGIDPSRMTFIDNNEGIKTEND